MAFNSQALIDAVDDINTALIANHDWYPGDATKLGNYIHAYRLALALRPALAALGGNDGEEVRYAMDVHQRELERLEKKAVELETQGNYGSRAAGFRQNQLSRCGDRWATT